MAVYSEKSANLSQLQVHELSIDWPARTGAELFWVHFRNPNGDREYIFFVGGEGPQESCILLGIWILFKEDHCFPFGYGLYSRRSSILGHNLGFLG